MPRVTEEYRATRRAEILHAAAHCFVRGGFHSTSMADIIRESGLSAGTMYLYFRSKEEIIGAVAEQTLHTADEIFADLLADGAAPAPAEVLAVLVERVGELRLAGSDSAVDLSPLTVQVWGEAIRNRELGARVNDAYLRLRAHWTEVARRWRDAGNLHPDAVPEQIGTVLLGLVEGFLIQHVLISDTTTQDYVAGAQALLSPARTEIRKPSARRTRRGETAQ
ncbi:TetR/AcrR family transcriptional regulator [Nocardia alni]|uniref:TetR/AcrR family transcriptional regulator n=1 Tax=Nocardia alni TaxID=2815723 RepID=UPI001C24C662|nr:TetR/AcrR family transcriptional regulator [Nocardia alni]